MSSEFQSSSELLITENCLPLTDEVTVDLVLLKMLATFRLLALYLEILGYIPHRAFERIRVFPKNM